MVLATDKWASRSIPGKVTLSDTDQHWHLWDHKELDEEHEECPFLTQAAELGVVNTFQHTATLLEAGMTCETGPSVPSLAPWENVSFGIRPSVLFEMFLVWPCLAGLRWEKSNPSFLLSSRLRNELARFLPQFVSLSTCSIFSLLPLSWSWSHLFF